MKLYCIAFIFFAAVVLRAQPLIDPFPYSLSPTDTVHSSVLFVPPAEQAGLQGRIGISNGRFVYPDGSPARFIGTVLYNTACFPDSADATALAARLRSFGFNAVRFMNYDYSYWNEASILQPFFTASSDGLDPAQIKRFDWLVYQLKQNGIYIHLPLLVSRTARSNDGVTAWDSIPYGGRMVTFFDAALQRQHRLFIRMLLDHVNPYTGVAYKNEPALAWLDLTDNNSFFLNWLTGWLSHQDETSLLSHYHSRMLDTLFADFLRKKYNTDTGLDQAWRRQASTTANLLANPGYEDPFSSVWMLDLAENVQALVEPSETDKKEGSRSLRLRINKADGVPTSIILSNASAKIEKFRLYELRFWAKAGVPSRAIRAHLQMSYSPYSNLGINYRSVALTDQWQEYSIPFRAVESDNSGAFLAFLCGETTGDVFLDNVHITMLDEPGLQPGEHLATATVHRPLLAEGPVFSPQRTRDLMEFYTGLVSDYNTQTRSFIRDSIGCHALVGGGTSGPMLNDLYAMRDMDFTAASETWDYVRNQQANWYIGNDGMLGTPYAGRIPFLARHAIEGKPLVVTQFAMPYPSAHVNEMLTVLPAYAAYQGWDAVYLAAYATERGQLHADSIVPGSFYDYRSNPAFMSVVPSAAGAFRRGLLSSAREKVLLDQTREALLYPYALMFDPFWLESGTDSRLPLFRRVSVARFDAPAQSVSPHTSVFQLSGEQVNTSEMLSDNGELLWNADDTLFTINTPGYIAATGNIGGPIFRFGSSVMAERLSGGRTGTFTWISGDNTPVASARHSLLTLSSRSLNSGAVWSGDSTVYSNTGTAPTVVEPMRIAFTVTSTADSLLAYPLDNRGLPTGEVITATKTQDRFRLIIDQKLHRSLWFRIEQKQVTTGVSDSDFQQPVLTAYPQPAGKETFIAIRLPAGTPVQLSIVGISGIETEVWRGAMADNQLILPVPSHLPSGVYLLRATTPTGVFTTSVVILR